MRMLKQALGVLGALFVLAIIVAFVAPNRARAVAATMVEVVNTVSNSVPSEDIYRLPSRNIQLVCNASDCAIAEQNGTFDGSTPWKVPSGMDFIITDVEITTYPTASTPETFFSLKWTPPNGTLQTFGWQVLSNGVTVEYQFTNGIVILPGSTPTPIFGGPTVEVAVLRGYITPN
jgi:hypothetical protein